MKYLQERDVTQLSPSKDYTYIRYVVSSIRESFNAQYIRVSVLLGHLTDENGRIVNKTIQGL